jgi:HAMP domain-containing protein
MKTFRLLLAMLLLVGLASSAFATGPTSKAFIKAKHYEHTYALGNGSSGYPGLEEDEFGMTVKDVISFTIIANYDSTLPVSLAFTYDGFVLTPPPPAPVTTYSGNNTIVTTKGTGENVHAHTVGNSPWYTVRGYIKTVLGSGIYAQSVKTTQCKDPNAIDDPEE